MNALNLIGYASGIAANNRDCALGPWYLYYHPELWDDLSFKIHWQTIIKAHAQAQGGLILQPLYRSLKKLGHAVLKAQHQQKVFCVLGGDHTSAMGTWSAVAHFCRPQDIGLIWIDAHMDSHTPRDSLTHNYHGMPVAHLLGYGETCLVHLLDKQPKIKPQNLCLIGIRSFEASEHHFLQQQGVKIFYQQDILTHGIHSVLQQAYQHVTRHTSGFGLSLDLDGIDPMDAPGVGCPEPHGIAADALINALGTFHFMDQPSFLGMEIVEFNPLSDINQKTAQLIPRLIEAVFHARRNRTKK